jgi:Tfp pilus assembly protein PilO
MKKYFEQLRPAERRLAVGFLVVIIVGLNWYYIWPHFSDWGNLGSQIQQSQQTLRMYQDAIAQEPATQLVLKKYESQGEFVAPDDQSINMMQALSRQSALTGVGIVNSSRSMSHTNDAFYVEQMQSITVVATDEQLVNFLYNLGNDPSMIRVRDLELAPDGPRQHLNATIQLVASYQRTPGKTLKNATASSQ